MNNTIKREYHKPIYGLSKDECLTKRYRRYFNGRCSYKKCRGKSHFYNKHGKCLSMKHYDDVEPSRKKKYIGNNSRKLCETTHRGSNWRYYNNECFRKSCKTVGSVFAYYNGRCTPRGMFFKHIMKKFRLIEENANRKIKNVKDKTKSFEYKQIYSSAKKHVDNIKQEAKNALNKTESSTTSSTSPSTSATPNKENDSNNKANKEISQQGNKVLKNIQNRIRSLFSSAKK